MSDHLTLGHCTTTRQALPSTLSCTQPTQLQIAKSYMTSTWAIQPFGLYIFPPLLITRLSQIFESNGIPIPRLYRPRSNALSNFNTQLSDEVHVAARHPTLFEGVKENFYNFWSQRLVCMGGTICEGRRRTEAHQGGIIALVPWKKSVCDLLTMYGLGSSTHSNIIGRTNNFNSQKRPCSKSWPAVWLNLISIVETPKR